MRDTELYRHLLGIESPWTVTRVDLNVKRQVVEVFVEHKEGEHWPCPECGASLSVYDHAPERRWRHLDSCQFQTYLCARPPRVNCPTHGVKQVRLPWAEPNSRFTAMFERLVIDVLRETDVSGAGRILNLSWDEAWHVMERAVRRGLLAKGPRVTTRIGVDEKAAAKGHKYLTLVCDLDKGTIEHIADDRKSESLDGYFKTRTPEQLQGIEAVAIDMWEPYVKSICEHVPGGADKIVFDRFHIMQHIGKAVDTVRKQEHRQLRAEGDDTLKRTKYLWLYSWENVPKESRARFNDLRTAELKTSRAWAIKESLRHLWDFIRLPTAEAYWKRWYFWATHSRLTPVVAAARTIQRHLHNVLTYFTHRITNATSEGLNSKIQTIKNMAAGFRNRENFKTAIYFHCGGLELYPPSSATH
jgi:transposase